MADYLPEDKVIELNQLQDLAPAVDQSLYFNLISSNLTFFYRNATTGSILTNNDQSTTPVDLNQPPEALVNTLLSSGYAFHLDFKQGMLRRSRDLTADDLPAAINQFPLNMRVKDDVQLTILLDTDFNKADKLRTMSIQYSKEQSWAVVALILLAAAFAMFILAWVFLLRFAGFRHQNDSAIKIAWIDRVFGEILIVLGIILIYILYKIAFSRYFDELASPYVLTGIAVYLVVGVILLTITRRYKAGILWKQNLLFKVGWLIKYFYQNRNLFWKVMIAYFAFILLAFTAVMLAANGSPFRILVALAALTLLPTLFVLLPIIGWSIQFQKISQTAEKMGLDAFTIDMPTEKLKPDLRKLTNTLSSTHDRIQLAVAEQMKSERLKTDLISNVSHDLRTPLTSIISYLDLLRLELDNPIKRTEYLNVLDQKSQRLKDLTENLFEAAKASSGNMPVQKSKVILNELIHQMAGEFSDKLSKHQLSLIINEPVDVANNPAIIEIISDGGHIWRILDNLMTNICKYAMESTRVYLDIKQEEDNAIIELKNISRERLNCSAEELQQRFVRGDQSRHTDGSGLGLAIASSLAELLNGKLTIQLDGDLFKTKLVLPIEREKQWSTSLVSNL